ncbi:MAG: type III-B CRISPR module-associated protein Cmr5 [Candidatus Brocadia sp.]|uniref:CRISPR type III-B/RAMP module-associated protein Cmr5 n=1 Tax=Candidatus Brocadia fulgida TaxID=380242 RepID=A0A0M2UTC3_9BACT|nr:MAG: CRISPR-associated protein (Cas Cmr5) [Candidatus Brocadia fulgida]UJS21577.1 MAG: type III-B CRISPR module-associated protein Cmr5 [Candidatus Brocadia sp.]
MADITGTDGGKKLQPASVARGGKVLPLMQEMIQKLDETKVNFLKGLPPMIMQNGLGQTIAYLQSKEGYEDIVDVFKKLFGEDNLIDAILNMEVKEYALRQKEAIEYAGWMKKFALAFYIKTNKERGDETPAS